LLSSAISARADDRSAGVPLPGLVSVPPGSVRAAKAWIDLNGDAVTVRLLLKRVAKAAVLRIPGPRFGWLGEAETYPDRNFPELSAALNGTELPDRSTAAVFVGQQNITADVHDAGLDPFVIAETPPFVDRPDGPGRAAFDRLIARHAVEREDHQFFARWTAQRLFQFDLGTDRAPSFSLSYRARPAFDLLALDDLAHGRTLDAYCATVPQLRRWFEASGRASNAVIARRYAIPAGIDGRTPPAIMVHVTGGDAVFCGGDGRAIVSGPGDSPVQARPGVDGVVRLLRLAPPG
jgi:hypothetical protein